MIIGWLDDVITIKRKYFYINKLMQVLELSESSQEIQKKQLYHLLKIAFQRQKMLTVEVVQQAGKIKVTYHGNLMLPKVNSHIGVQWQCKIADRLILIDLKLNSASMHSFKLCQFLRNQSQIKQFVHLINNLNLCNTQGSFYFKKNTGELVLRQKIANHRVLSSQSVMIKYFVRCIKKLSKVFLQQIQQIIFYYRLPGISLSQAEKYFQQKNQVPLMQQTQAITYLKKCFEIDREKRPHSSKSAVNLNGQIAVSSSMQLLLTNNQTNPLSARQQKQENDKINCYSNMYKHQKEALTKDVTPKKNKEMTHIVTGVKIKQVIMQTSIGYGGFSQIFFGIYHYLPQISIYPNSQSPLLAQLNNQQNIIKSGLIKKVSNTLKGEQNISLQNQCNFLVYMRNKTCPYIAQYFCKSQFSRQPFSNKQIYIDYYPDNLKNTPQKQDRRMKIMEDVCLALLFMNGQKLIHRDLKEDNIMVDRYHRGKLIDFGSVANIKGSNNFKERDNVVRSTKKYFRPFKTALLDFPGLKDFMNIDEYYTHQTFDLYSLGVILQNQFYLNQFTNQNHFVRNNLKLLSDKCRQSNPQDRWTIQQVTVFLRHLMIFYQLRRQFWNWGFDPKFKAHQLGKYYNGNGSYNLRVKKQIFVGNNQL